METGVKPTAAPARFPYTEHRDMAQVMADEALEASVTHPLDSHCPKCGAIPGQVCIGKRGHERKAFHRERGTRRNHAALHVSRHQTVESPIEAVMVAAIDEWLECHGVDYAAVSTQVPFGPYRADIWVQASGHNLVIECDGAAFHGSMEQVAHDKRRDRYCALQNIAVMRFSGAEIMGDPRGCAAQIGAWIRGRQ